MRWIMILVVCIGCHTPRTWPAAGAGKPDVYAVVGDLSGQTYENDG